MSGELAGEPRRADEQAAPALIDREERRRAVADAQRELIGRQSRDLLSARHRQLLEDEVAAQRLAEDGQRRRRGADAGELNVWARWQPTRHEGGADRNVRRIQQEVEAAAERHVGHVDVHRAVELSRHAVAEEQELSGAFREPDELRGAVTESEAGMAGRELDRALVIGPIHRGVVGIEDDFFEPEVRGDHLSQDRQPEPQPAELDEGPGGVGLLGRAELHEDLMVGADRERLVQRLREAVEANPGGARDPDVRYPDDLEGTRRVESERTGPGVPDQTDPGVGQQQPASQRAGLAVGKRVGPVAEEYAEPLAREGLRRRAVRQRRRAEAHAPFDRQDAGDVERQRGDRDREDIALVLAEANDEVGAVDGDDLVDGVASLVDSQENASADGDTA